MADDSFDLPSASEEEVMGGLDEDEAMKDLETGMGDEDYLPPTMKVGEEKEIGNEGLKKKLVKEGEGWDRPELGDEVEGTCMWICARTSLYRLLALENGRRKNGVGKWDH
jgi:FK506-binding protein 4/5